MSVMTINVNPVSPGLRYAPRAFNRKAAIEVISNCEFNGEIEASKSAETFLEPGTDGEPQGEHWRGRADYDYGKILKTDGLSAHSFCWLTSRTVIYVHVIPCPLTLRRTPDRVKAANVATWRPDVPNAGRNTILQVTRGVLGEATPAHCLRSNIIQRSSLDVQLIPFQDCDRGPRAGVELVWAERGGGNCGGWPHDV